MKLSSFFWTLPFICFIGTYVVLAYIFAAPSLPTPSLIGKQLPQAFAILSENNLNPRILRMQADNDVPVGTILSQIPEPGQKIKPHQQLFITVSKLKDKAVAPQLVNTSYEAARERLKNENITHKAYHLISKKARGTVIAQLPSSGTQLVDNSMAVYVSQGSTKPVICPEFTGRSAHEVVQFLSAYKIKPEIYHVYAMPHDHVCSAHCKVINQQPLAGSIIDIDGDPLIQLKVTD